LPQGHENENTDQVKKLRKIRLIDRYGRAESEKRERKSGADYLNWAAVVGK